MYCTIYFNKYVTKVDEYSISPLNTIKYKMYSKKRKKIYMYTKNLPFQSTSNWRFIILIPMTPFNQTLTQHYLSSMKFLVLKTNIHAFSHKILSSDLGFLIDIICTQIWQNSYQELSNQVSFQIVHQKRFKIFSPWCPMMNFSRITAIIDFESTQNMNTFK